MFVYYPSVLIVFSFLSADPRYTLALIFYQTEPRVVPDTLPWKHARKHVLPDSVWKLTHVFFNYSVYILSLFPTSYLFLFHFTVLFSFIYLD